MLNSAVKHWTSAEFEAFIAQPDHAAWGDFTLPVANIFPAPPATQDE